MELQENKIQLYCNQVFVTDNVEGIVPRWLTLLHGVIDSPDIPLNVSRSYLQSDQNVKKISNHITKKVADALEELFKKERSQYEEKWDSMRIFIEIGILSDEKFYDRASKFFLFRNTEKKYFSLEEYQNTIKNAQTDKDGNVIALYATDAVEQHAYIQAAKTKGYDVLLMDGRFDTMLFNALEQKNEKLRFLRVDADVVDRLIVKDELRQSDFSKDEQEALTTVFRSQLPKMEKTDFMVDFQNLGAETQPLIITQGEFMRRMKDMAASGANPMMSFYGEMPDSFNLVVNTANPLVQQLLKDEEQACADQISPLREKKKRQTRISRHGIRPIRMPRMRISHKWIRRIRKHLKRRWRTLVRELKRLSLLMRQVILVFVNSLISPSLAIACSRVRRSVLSFSVAMIC